MQSKANPLMSKPSSRRDEYDRLVAQLELKREGLKKTFKDLSRFIRPSRSKFFLNDVDKSDRRSPDIIDATATLASRTLASGMMTGLTSPARPWFKLGISNPELAESEAVRTFLERITQEMRNIFLRSNLYNVLHPNFGDAGTFGTSAIYQEEDIEDVVTFQIFPIGSYTIADDEKGRVRTFQREFQLSVRQIVEKFGMGDVKDPNKINWENISQEVQNLWETGNHEHMIDIVHIIRANPRYNPRRLESKFKRFESVYYEKGTQQNATSGDKANDVFLSDKGYDYFPVYVTRWEKNGEDAWGTNAPGFVALGDVKQLQHTEKRVAQALDQKIRPTMVGPTSLKHQNTSLLPGDITYLDEREGQKGFRRLFEIDFDIRETEQKQIQVRQRISKAYYEDLFLMLAQSDRRQITAREIDERHQEKLLALGPVLEQVNRDLLDPLIENTLIVMEKRGMLDDMPEEMIGQDYKIEYISIMAQAQKMADLSNIERFTGYVANIASTIDPMAAKKINYEEIIDAYAERGGIPPNLVRSKEEMERIVQMQQMQQMQLQQQQAQADAVQGAKTLSETEVAGGNALDQILGAAGG